MQTATLQSLHHSQSGYKIYRFVFN